MDCYIGGVIQARAAVNLAEADHARPMSSRAIEAMTTRTARRCVIGVKSSVCPPRRGRASLVVVLLEGS
jgi:hypothetical protein